MAKINFGTTVNDARGKLNGTVFSKNKSGAYMRKKVTPANPNTAAQTFVRNNFGGLSTQWSGLLSAAERATWISYAATYPRIDIFGASILISGLNMFISLSQVLLQTLSTIVLSAPVTNVVNPIAFDPTGLAAVGGASLIFQQTAAAAAATDKFYIFGARPLPPGRQPQRSDFRYIATLAGTAGPYPVNVDPFAAYVAKFGPFVAGQRISLLVATVDTTTGLTTVGTMMSAIAT